MINFTAAVLHHESTSLSSFQIEFRYEFRTSFDWKPFVKKSISLTERLGRKQANQMAGQMKEVWDFTRSFMKKAQVKQKKQADKHCQEINFDVGDYVYVYAKNWKMGRSNKKLDFPGAES